MKKLMGIDLGTSGLKVIIMDSSLVVLQSSFRSYDIVSDTSGSAVQNPLVWRSTLLECIGELDCSDVIGVGITGQMHGLVMLDADGKPLGDAIIWSDSRSTSQAEYINRYLSSVHNPTCNRVSSGFLISSLLWVKENQPSLYSQICRVMLPKDYLCYCLTGQIVTDPSDASGTGAYDVTQSCWCSLLLQELQVAPSLFPPIKPSTDYGVQVSGEYCPQLGGAWLAGGGDHAVQMLGNGLITPGNWNCNIGTASQLSIVQHTVEQDIHLRTNLFCHVLENRYNRVGATLNGGIVLKWVQKQLCPELSFAEMDCLVATLPCGSDGVAMIPYLNGERTPYCNPNLRAAWHGISLAHGREHMIRAAMEGMLFSLREVQAILAPQQKISSMITSGGVTGSPVMMQMQADIFNCDIYCCKVGEQAAVGAAILGGLASGMYTNVDQLLPLFSQRTTLVATPNPEHSEQYHQAFSHYCRVNRAYQQLAIPQYV